jgi:hypothetical protein
LSALGAAAGYALGGTASTQDPRSFSHSAETGDCLWLSGRLVYDPEYAGWNEIHAVMRIDKLTPRDCPQLTHDEYVKMSQALWETETPAVRKRELVDPTNRFLLHRSLG